MIPGSGERKLLAILNGDVVGYSRLMATDEEATIEMLAGHLESIGRIVVANHGRLVDFVGDNFLAEFGSAIHAVHCAVQIQTSVNEKVANIPVQQRMTFRIGAHLGDVRIEGDRIYGDAVNIASRLQSLSEAGGICLSRQILEQVTDHIDLGAEDLGAQKLKNIRHLVNAYSVSAASLSNGPPMRRENQQNPEDRNALPGGIPTIAVLPFTNLSTGLQHEHDVVDAMTADIITGLSCDPRFSVISRNSVMPFKGQHPDVREVGDKLGVRYVVEGTLRIFGTRFIVTMALIDVESRRELWGDKIDRVLVDIFEVFDDMVEAIVTALSSHLKMAEEERFRRRPPNELDAWTLTTQALATVYLNVTMNLDESIALVRRALEIDPNYAYAWAAYGFFFAFKFPLGLSTDHQADVDESLAATTKALALDSNDPWNLAAKAVALQYAGRAGESLEYLQRSLRLNPSDVITHCYYGRGLMFSGKPAVALPHFERFKRLNPNDPGAQLAGMYHSLALVFLQQWEHCEEIARDAIADSAGRNPWTWVALVVSLEAQDRSGDVAAAMLELKKAAPHWDRQFVENFLSECQDAKELLPPLFRILRRAWQDERT